MIRFLRLTAVVVLSAVMVCAGVMKVLDPRSFQDAILDYQMVPDVLATVLAWWLPWLELTLGIGLWMPRYARSAAILAACVLAVFIVALGVAVLRGLSVSCGCFGVASHDAVTALLMDIPLLAASVWLAMQGNTHRGGPRVSAETPRT